MPSFLVLMDQELLSLVNLLKKDLLMISPA